jgi:hypothetical protein
VAADYKKPTARHLFRNTPETAKHHLISCRKGREISRNNKLPGGRNVPSDIPIEIYFSTAAADGCCCWWLLLLAAAAAAINQPLKQETNSQTPFSNHIRNSNTPPNFVPTMAQNHSQ